MTTRQARRGIAKSLRRNPGLQHHPAHSLAEAYQVIRGRRHRHRPAAGDLPRGLPVDAGTGFGRGLLGLEASSMS